MVIWALAAQLRFWREGVLAVEGEHLGVGDRVELGEDHGGGGARLRRHRLLALALYLPIQGGGRVVVGGAGSV